MKELSEIPDGFRYHCTWGHMPYTQLWASVDVHKRGDEIILEISDTKEVFKILEVSDDEMGELNAISDIDRCGLPILEHFGYFDHPKRSKYRTPTPSMLLFSLGCHSVGAIGIILVLSLIVS